MTRFDSSFGGLGGCPFVPGAAGNISTEDVLNFCEESGIATGIDLEQVMELSRSLRRLLGHDLDSYVLRPGRARDLILSYPARVSLFSFSFFLFPLHSEAAMASQQGHGCFASYRI